MLELERVLVRRRAPDREQVPRARALVAGWQQGRLEQHDAHGALSRHHKSARRALGSDSLHDVVAEVRARRRLGDVHISMPRRIVALDLRGREASRARRVPDVHLAVPVAARTRAREFRPRDDATALTSSSGRSLTTTSRRRRGKLKVVFGRGPRTSATSRRRRTPAKAATSRSARTAPVTSSPPPTRACRTPRRCSPNTPRVATPPPDMTTPMLQTRPTAKA